MAINVTLHRASKETDYPCLKEMPSGNIVLFTAPRRGVVVRASGTNNRKLGEDSIAWDEDEAELFHGTITLSNK